MDKSTSEKTNGFAQATLGSPTRTLEKGLFLLGLFDIDHPGWSPRELREMAGLPKATAQRLLKTLEESDWLEYDAPSCKYHLGSSALRAYYVAVSNSELVRIAHPILVQLTEETRESSNLSVWTDNGALIIDTVLTGRHYKPATSVGMLLNGFASADSQVLIAFGPEATWDRILAGPLEPRTRHTVTDPDSLRVKWRMIRHEGFAIDREEWREDAPGVAAPVFDRTGNVRASISMAAPVERFSEVQAILHAAAVKRAAAALSAKLGYRI